MKDSKLYFTEELSRFMSTIDKSENKETSTSLDVTYLLILGMIVSNNNGYRLTEYGSDWLSQRVSIPLFIVIENDKIKGCSTQLITEYGKVFPKDYDLNNEDMYVFEEPIPIENL